jgi:thymidylate synthase (FAD)
MAHALNPKADALLDREFKVLDKGFVRLVDYMGGDDSIVQAARVSYGEGTKKIQEDRGLIRYLMRHHHTTPFEMVEFKFHVKLPIFIARQWIRHRTANVNEYSGRYSIMKEEFYLPKPSDIQTQSTRNKQGRSDDQLPEAIKAKFLDDLSRIQSEAYRIYSGAIDNDIARELARIDLPLSLYTEWYWKIDLHNLFHFLRLRIDDHAQKEFREYAVVIADMVRTVCPMAHEAFEDYLLNAVTFSGPELELLKAPLGTVTDQIEHLTDRGLSKREAAEFIEKLAKIRNLSTD